MSHPRPRELHSFQQEVPAEQTRHRIGYSQKCSRKEWENGQVAVFMFWQSSLNGQRYSNN